MGVDDDEDGLAAAELFELLSKPDWVECIRLWRWFDEAPVLENDPNCPPLDV